MSTARQERQLDLRIPGDLHDRLRDAAHERGISLNWLCARLLHEGVERLIPAEQFSLTRPDKDTEH